MRERNRQYFMAASVLSILVGGLVTIAAAQTLLPGPSATGEISTPIPGVGHDYVHLLSETVDPSSGSVNLDIQFPVSASRGITIPVSFGYHSGGIFHLSQAGFGLDLASFCPPNGGAPFGTGCGWNYGMPSMAYSFTSNPGLNNGTCYFANHYAFTDAQGTSHNLQRLAQAWTSGTQTGCVGTSQTDPATQASDEAITAVHPAGSYETFTVYDEKGTVYSNFQNFGGFGEESIIEVPVKIEDRNGNIVQASYALTNGAYNVGFTDTSGRPAVAISGHGTSGTTDTVTAGGLSLSIDWTSTTANYSMPIQQQGTSPYGITCPSGTPSTSNITNPPLISTIYVPSAIHLPNGTEFTFYSGNTNPTDSTILNNYGLLNEIIYPGGGWVKYTYAESPLGTNYSVLAGYNSTLAIWQANQCNYEYSTPVVATRQVSYDGVHVALTQTFTYSTSGGTGSWNSKTTTVTTTDQTQAGESYVTTYSYTPYQIPNEPYSASNYSAQLPLENQIITKDWGGVATLSTITKTWTDQFSMTEQDTTVGSLTSKIKYTPGSYRPTEIDEYDFGASSATRKTAITYESFTTNGTILDSPCKKVVNDGSGNRLAETDTYYDGGSTLCGADTSGGATAQVSSLPSGTHDETLFGPSKTASRGNATTVTKICISCTNATTTYAYDETGQVISMKDPCGNVTCTDINGSNHTTTYSYTDSPSGGDPYGNSNAYLTSITYPSTGGVTLQKQFTYNYTTGYLASSIDENSQTTVYKYGIQPSGCAYQDELDRLGEIDYPDTGRTTHCYNDSAPNPSVTTTTWATPDPNQTNISIMDGMGHVIQTQLTSDPSGTDYVNSTYDGGGRVFTKTNPFRGSSPPANTTTTNYYDASGRPIETVEQDGSTLQWCYNDIASTPAVYCRIHKGSMTGTWVDSTDENGNHWQRTSDGLGRLTEVMEPSSTSQLASMETDYVNDPLNNLTSVTQCGALCPSANPVNRSFTYDSLSRLQTTTNPESGQVTYTYDANGNVQTKKSPLVNAATGTQTMSYCYDPLDRMTYKFYPGASVNCTSPSGFAASYSYDTSSISGAANDLGRLTDEKAYIAGTLASERSPYNFDPMGRLQDEQQSCKLTGCNGVTYTPAYTYDLVGNVWTANAGLPSGLSGVPSGTMRITYGYNGADQLIGVTSSLTETANFPSQLFTGALYNTIGLTSATLGHNQTLSTTMESLTRTYDRSRMRILSETDAPVSPYSYGYSYSIPSSGGYDAVGNLTSVTDAVTGTFAYGYDYLNRLITGYSSSGPAQGEYGCSSYDPWGNRTAYSLQFSSCPTPETSVPPTVTYNGQNKVTWVQNVAPAGYLYDGAGNVLNDGVNNYFYDSEGRLCAVQTGGNGGPATGYVYDAEGRRVAEGALSSWPSCGLSNFTPTKSFVLGLNGEQVSEITISGSSNAWQHTNVFAGGKVLATYNGNNTYIPLTDWVGTKRAEVGASNCYDTWFGLPYGDDIVLTAATCPVDATEHHYTGKERDLETGEQNGNDYFGARYYQSSMGRFLSPDWSANVEPVPYAKLDNPQSLNLYAYALNNPLTHVDPDGHACIVIFGVRICFGNIPPPPIPPPPLAPPPKPPGIPKDVPSSHVPGPEYKTADAAAKAAIRKTNPQSVKDNKEIAGRTVKNDNMTYGNTRGPESGRTVASSDPGAVPAGTVNAAIWHDHGANTPGYDNENFSQADYGRATAEGVPIYVGTPGGQIREYDPQTNVDAQVGTTPH